MPAGDVLRGLADTLGWASAMAYDVPAQVSIGRSLGMSPNAITSSASTPRSAASSARVDALVTSGPLISSSVEAEDQVIVIRWPTAASAASQ